MSGLQEIFAWLVTSHCDRRLLVSRAQSALFQSYAKLRRRNISIVGSAPINVNIQYNLWQTDTALYIHRFYSWRKAEKPLRKIIFKKFWRQWQCSAVWTKCLVNGWCAHQINLMTSIKLSMRLFNDDVKVEKIGYLNCSSQSQKIYFSTKFTASSCCP